MRVALRFSKSRGIEISSKIDLVEIHYHKRMSMLSEKNFTTSEGNNLTGFAQCKKSGSLGNPQYADDYSQVRQPLNSFQGDAAGLSENDDMVSVTITPVEPPFLNSVEVFLRFWISFHETFRPVGRHLSRRPIGGRQVFRFAGPCEIGVRP